MLKRLERQAMEADLAAVRGLLNERTEEDDPVGWMQFSERISFLENRLKEFDAQSSNKAEVGLFFGGRPVLGSHGILADFSSRILNEFQTLVTSAHASADGWLGSRGPFPQRERTQLMITNVARGSFGFVLEQATDLEMFETDVKSALDTALDLVSKVASSDQENFEEITEELDSRVFNSLKNFVRLLDDSGATLRIMDSHREIELERSAISLAISRTRDTTFVEEEVTRAGILYVLPSSRQFELHPGTFTVAFQEPIKGKISNDCMRELTGGSNEVRPGIIGSFVSARLRVKSLQGQSPHSTKRSYVLLSFSPTDRGNAMVLHNPLTLK
jgi:hypothetical protein